MRFRMVNERCNREVQETLDRFLGSRNDIASIERLAGGFSNQNFRVHIGSDIYVLRLCRDQCRHPNAELACLQLSIAPELVHYERHTGNMLTRWIPGTLAAEAPMSPGEAYTYTETLHASIPTGIASYDPILETRGLFEHSGKTGFALKAFREIDWRPRHVSGCHNDLHPWNILRTGDGFRTLDWESAGDNDPMFDLVSLASGLNYNDDQFAALLDEYWGEAPDPLHVWNTRLLFQCREHAWALAQLSNGIDHEEIHFQIQETEKEIHRLMLLKE